MIELSPPSKALAATILARVSFEQRLVGVKMTPMAGNAEQPLISLREAANFLQMESLEQVIAAGPRASIPYVDPMALQTWIREVFGDQELSDAIKEQTAKGKNYREQAGSMRELLLLRLEQAGIVLETDQEDGG